MVTLLDMSLILYVKNRIKYNKKIGTKVVIVQWVPLSEKKKDFLNTNMQEWKTTAPALTLLPLNKFQYGVPR